MSDEDLMSLRDDSLVVNLNSMSEVDRCLRLRIPNRIALRINPDIGAGHHRDVVTGGFGVKFGIDLAEVDEARKVLEDHGHSIIGLHAHIGSGITEISPLLASAARLAGLTDRFSALEWVNFGGGISVPYRPREVEFPLDEYGRSLGDLVGPRLRERNLRAILEPGRFLVAQSGVLLTTVTTKRISNGFEWLGVDTGFNHLVRPSRYGAYHHILNASRSDDSWLRENFGQTTSNDSGVIIAGNLCESGDVFTREGEEPRLRPMPPTRVGDLLAICDTGAYGFSMASHYNARLLPAEVLVDGSEATVIRERQTFEDLLH